MIAIYKKTLAEASHYIPKTFEPVKDDLKWLDNHPDSDHLRNRISRSRIIHALSRLETFHSELFIDPINPNLGKKLSRRLLSIFNQLPSTKLLSDEDLFTPCVKYFTGKFESVLLGLINMRT